MAHPDWGLPIAIDLLVAGFGAAAFLVAVIVDFAGSKKFAGMQLVGAVIAPCSAILGVLFLVFDMSRQMRFWEMMLERGEVQSSGSTMSWGTWILALFVIISLIYMIISIITKLLSKGMVVRKVVGIIGLPFAVLITFYAGILISAFSNNPWNIFLFPIIFAIFAMVTSIAVMAIILVISKFLRGMIFKKAGKVLIPREQENNKKQEN